MADSPLARLAPAFAALGVETGGALQIAEVPFLTQLNLRVDPSVSIGVPLPAEPNTYARAGDLLVLWLGPDEWLVIAPPDTDDLEERLRAELPPGGAVIDVSAQRTTLRLFGPAVRDVLARGCALDLDPRAFTGRCAQTLVARTQAILVEEAGEFLVLVRSSFAGYLGEWLLDAASEYRSAALT
jgi:sarcosine oxidase, subunit gamma